DCGSDLTILGTRGILPGLAESAQSTAIGYPVNRTTAALLLTSRLFTCGRWEVRAELSRAFGTTSMTRPDTRTLRFTEWLRLIRPHVRRTSSSMAALSHLSWHKAPRPISIQANLLPGRQQMARL